MNITQFVQSIKGLETILETRVPPPVKDSDLIDGLHTWPAKIAGEGLGKVIEDEGFLLFLGLLKHHPKLITVFLRQVLAYYTSINGDDIFCEDEDVSDYAASFREDNEMTPVFLFEVALLAQKKESKPETREFYLQVLYSFYEHGNQDAGRYIAAILARATAKSVAT